jgi:hypothetical protein
MEMGSLRRFVLPITVAALLGGCGGDDALQSPTAARLKGLATMYLDYIVAKGGNAPPSEAELKKHMRSIDAIQLNLAGFERDKIDEAFISERDKEPFVVRYGIAPGTLGAKDGPVVAHEKTGAGGKKLVVNVGTVVSHVSDNQLQELLKPKGK